MFAALKCFLPLILHSHVVHIFSHIMGTNSAVMPCGVCANTISVTGGLHLLQEEIQKVPRMINEPIYYLHTIIE